MLTIPRPHLDILKKKVNDIAQNLAKELGKELSKLTLRAMEKIVQEVNPTIKNVEQKINAIEESLVRLCDECLNGKIKIEITREELRKGLNSSIPNLLNAKAIFSLNGLSKKLEVECMVACGHWKNLGEISENSINLLDHLEKLLPASRTKNEKKGPISLVTFQNGMMNSPNDFKLRCRKIIDQFKEAPLFIGLHNPSTSFILTDMARFLNESEKNALGVYSLCQLFRTCAEQMAEINPNHMWAHFAHSEAGLIANAVFKVSEKWKLSNGQTDIKKHIKNHLIAATYGAVKPIADDDVHFAINTYSKNDIALFFGKSYLDKDPDEIKEKSYESKKVYRGKMYTVRIIESVTKKDPWLKIPRDQNNQEVDISTKAVFNTINNLVYSIDDHDFTNDSYQSVFEKNVNDLRQGYNIHNGKSG